MDCSRTLSIFWYKGNPKETKGMLSCYPQQSIGSQKINATPKKIRETLEMLGMDFSDSNKNTESTDIVKMEAK